MPIQPYTLTGVALVTGAANGIGRATAIAFAYEGVTRLVLADVDVPGMAETTEQLKALDSSIESIEVRTDTSSPADVDHLVAQAVKAFGCINYCVNAAGINANPRRVSHELSIDDWDKILKVNLRGVWLCQRAQIAQMLKQAPQEQSVMRLTGAPPERGAIVNIASVLSKIASQDSGSYAAAKHGVLGQTRTDAAAYGQHGIRVNAVCPGLIHTRMVEQILAEGNDFETLLSKLAISRYGRPEEVAQACVFLASPRASLITGEEICVDAGLLHCF